MGKIHSAIIFSDMHLGRELSYLYFENPSFKKNREVLIDFLKRLGPQEEVILNGDILELSLAGHDDIYRDVKEFFKILSECGPYGRILYIPGNHDHHFWRSLGEQVNVNGRVIRGIEPPGHNKYSDYFVDERISSSDAENAAGLIFPELWPGNDKPEFVVKYPNHLIKILSDNGRVNHYLITHGHFLEDLFRPVNYLIDPAHLEELEAFNNIWLEAFDYHLGHAGRMSEVVRAILKSYEKGGKEAKEKVRQCLAAVRDNLKRKLKLGWFKTFLLKIAIIIVVKKIPHEKESGLFKAPLDEKLKSSIKGYLETYILKRYKEGQAEEFGFPIDKDIPRPFTFVFGHTHRPVRDEDRNDAFVSLSGEKYSIYNSGGWLRTDGPMENGENAGVLVINQDGIRWESLEGQLK